jgi:hypothetical protein
MRAFYLVVSPVIFPAAPCQSVFCCISFCLLVLLNALNLSFLPACRAGIYVCPSFALFYIYCSIHTVSDCHSACFVFQHSYMHSCLSVFSYVSDLPLACPCRLSLLLARIFHYTACRLSCRMLYILNLHRRRIAIQYACSIIC